MKDSKLAIFFLGPPGAGKDTQAELLAKKLNLELLSSGDIVRHNLKQNSVLQKMYDAGKLMPPQVMTQWTKQAIDLNKSFVFSGALRTLLETKELTSFLRENGYKIKVFHIQISPEETLKRNLLRARDIIDTEEKIKERLKVYEKQTKPVLGFLADKVIQINGEQSIENVHKDICHAGGPARNASHKSDAGGWKNSGTNNGAACTACQAKCPFARIK